MGWYAKQGGLRHRQVVSDATFVGWVVLWTIISWFASKAIAGLANPLRSSRQTVESMRDHIHDAAIGAGTVPIGGGQLRPPLDALSQDVNGLVLSLNTQIRAIEMLARVSGILLVLIPTLLYLMFWLPRRLRTARAGEHTPQVQPSTGEKVPAVSGQGISDGAHAAPQPPSPVVDQQAAKERLAALRAIIRADPERLLQITDDPVGAWERGDARVIRRFAALRPEPDDETPQVETEA